jgi:hypothetical protein
MGVQIAAPKPAGARKRGDGHAGVSGLEQTSH